MTHPSVLIQLERLAHRLAIVSTGMVTAGWVLLGVTGIARGTWKLVASGTALGFFLAARPLRKEAIALERQGQDVEDITLTAFQQWLVEALKPATPQTVLASQTATQKPVQVLPMGTDAVSLLARSLIEALNEFNVRTDFLGVAIGPSFYRIKLRPHTGVKFQSIATLADDLKIPLGLVDEPIITTQPGFIGVDLPRSDRQFLRLEDYIQPQSLPFAPVRIAIGVDLDGNLVELDLNDPNTCQCLVSGTTGSGKSEFLRSAVTSLLLRHSPTQVQIVLIDPKRVTFPEFDGCDWLWSPVSDFSTVIRDVSPAIGMLQAIVEEMETRYRHFEQLKVPHLDGYNQSSPAPLPRLVIFFDEIADFMSEKPIKQALEASAKRIGAMGRAAGIHLFLATQRPDQNVITPILRSNLPGRIALRVASEADSRIALGMDDGSAAFLLGKGDLLFQVGNSKQRLQALYTEPRLLHQVLRQHPRGHQAETQPIGVTVDVTAEEVGENSFPPSVTPEAIQALICYSLEHGWLTARRVQSGIRSFRKLSCPEIRACFQLLTTQGLGRLRGEDESLSWTAQPLLELPGKDAFWMK